MSDQPGQESIEDETLGQSYSVDDEDQLQPEDTLIGDEDPLDSGYTAPDRPQGLQAFGTTAEEQAQEETIEQRIRQEIPDPDTAYGAPDNESGLDRPADADRIGGNHPDSIPAEDDFLGDPVETDTQAGRIVAPDEGAHEDDEPEAVADEESATGGLSAEEAAVFVTDDGAYDDSPEDPHDGTVAG